METWQIDLLLDALDLMEEIESDDDDNYDPEPITRTRAALNRMRAMQEETL